MAELMNLPIRPTAVTCANDEMAIGALQCAHDLGMKVPGDVSITGFDMTSSSAHIYPPLTTVRNPIGDVAEAAVRAVNCLIEGKTPMESTVFQTDLVVRASTAPPCVHAHSEV
jgi:DNA-binding LacI/PurR family transcriptional regulator